MGIEIMRERAGQIGAALKIPVGSVRSALHRARATLRAELEGNDD